MYKLIATITCALALIATVPAFAASDNVDFGSNYSLKCRNLSGDMTTMTHQQMLDTISCIYYTRGALHGLVVAEAMAETYGSSLYDVPDNIGVEQLAKLTLRYIDQHPESMHQMTILLMGMALKEAFPPKIARRN